MSRWVKLLWVPVVMLALASILAWSGVALVTRPTRASVLLAWLILGAATVLAALGVNTGRLGVQFSSGGFRKGDFGSFVESKAGFTVQVTVDRFPGMRIRYEEGPRTMDVFAEAMAKTNHLVLDRSTMAYWNAPYTREGMDDATRQTVFDRIMTALSYGGYVIETDNGFPKSGDQVRRRIRLAELMQRWRDEKMNPPVPWQGPDTPK